MFNVVAPASTAAWSTSIMKSSGVRVASWGLNSTSSVCSRARATPRAVSSFTCSGVILSMCSMCDGQPGLDVVDTESSELLCDLELLPRVQGDARGLLPIAQRGVEEDHPAVA